MPFHPLNGPVAIGGSDIQFCQWKRRLKASDKRRIDFLQLDYRISHSCYVMLISDFSDIWISGFCYFRTYAVAYAERKWHHQISRRRKRGTGADAIDKNGIPFEVRESIVGFLISFRKKQNSKSLVSARGTEKAAPVSLRFFLKSVLVLGVGFLIIFLSLSLSPIRSLKSWL